MICGGPSEVKDIDAEVKELAVSLKGAVETKLGKTFSKYEPLKYTSQVVAGTNYKVKVACDGDEHVHVKIFQPLPHTGESPSVSECEGSKSLGDAL
eukprot:CAMPEP_0117598002 /NCGR_PEP_ID=MMETSP0784-20121206/75167_1 /TAXON_ID=39447 /ORGANISM="" /LENGTH=95 /DNA_ID=CAMNT_0005400429 /DNA_START=110 /DNA_END=397 /DNA_ORIENTATION=+